ncbi:MAG: hypothetical protein K6G03_03370 [Lachnospiraceae bacterium]|nr:hypothetical protein [Lachnospiraceae bacterium]
MTLSEKANDLKTSGYTLTLVGGAGTVAMILLDTGLIPFQLSGIFGGITKVVMTGLFLLFLFIGIRSLIRAGKVAKDAEREIEKKAGIEKWFRETYDAAAINENVDPDAEDNELYFERSEAIRQKITERFMDIEDSLMSELVDDLYSGYFD